MAIPVSKRSDDITQTKDVSTCFKALLKNSKEPVILISSAEGLGGRAMKSFFLLDSITKAGNLRLLEIPINVINKESLGSFGSKYTYEPSIKFKNDKIDKSSLIHSEIARLNKDSNYKITTKGKMFKYVYNIFPNHLELHEIGKVYEHTFYND